MVDMCDHTMIYKKANPSEIIEVGDIVMLDPETASITRAVIAGPEDYMINSRLIVGVCIKSDNTARLNMIIDGGLSKNFERELLDSGVSDSIQTIIIASGTSDQNAREIIQVAYSGEYAVNICGYVDLGDQLSISNHPGKARSKDYLDRQYMITRSIGKVIKYTNNRDQVKVLLDIE